uniref:Uncharacterized protein AlNc14C6G875 n=1 Tax=Albugo laibachii Nc14 TaxID=890382 RepID=F0W1A6_9STRA|nr:conserved hypothetical protein [Albugo laibachii Nc14]|eukprot:CCA14833.1 conserved hypothetical protein [Albugo laibachii Nc14]
MTSIIPTFKELHDFSFACDRLWRHDEHRLTPGVDYKVNLYRDGRGNVDGPKRTLFAFVDPKVLERPLVKHFIALLDNYERRTGERENLSSNELYENNQFLNELMKTKVMRYAYSWLVERKKFRGGESAFKKEVEAIWFDFYRRESQNDSSGFEHVFVGEERNGQVIGLHNWIQMYQEEKAGHFQYEGFVRPNQRGLSLMKPQEYEQLLTIRFHWHHVTKYASTSLIGVSPEFEVALYTLCFLNGDEDNIVKLGPYNCRIKCFSKRCGNRVRIAAAYPESNPLTKDQAAIRIQFSVRGFQVKKRTSQYTRN